MVGFSVTDLDGAGLLETGVVTDKYLASYRHEGGILQLLGRINLKEELLLADSENILAAENSFDMIKKEFTL